MHLRVKKVKRVNIVDFHLVLFYFSQHKTKPEPGESRDRPKTSQAAQPVPAGHQTPLDSHCAYREDAGQNRTLHGGEQQVKN